jgi:hypothetical protein
MSGKTSRRKGHNLEREIARMFREEAGFKHAKTARLASTLLDGCKGDIFGVPYLVQTKMGYKNNRPKPEEIFKDMEERLRESFPENDPVHMYPKVLIHKIDGRNKYHNLVTMPYDHFKYLILNQKQAA